MKQWEIFWRKLFYNGYGVTWLAQRGVALRIVSTYRTVSMSAVLVQASVATINLLVKERQETFQLRKELTCIQPTNR